MAWTAPRTWSTGELVTKAIMDTHVRDNLRYLKGLDGAVTIEDRMTLPVTSGTNGRGLRFASGANDFAGAQGFDDGSISYLILAANRYFDGTAYQQMNARAGANLVLNGSGFLTFNTFAAASNTQVERMRITSDGALGLGTASPQGPLQINGVGGKVLFLQANALNNTLQTLAVAGTVTTGAGFYIWDKNNTTGAVVVGSTSTAVNVGGPLTSTYANADTITFGVTAGGAITVQRTTGTNGTHQVLMIVFVF